jgi:hypothetical protein
MMNDLMIKDLELQNNKKWLMMMKSQSFQKVDQDFTSASIVSS